METKFDIQLTNKDLYGFNIYQTYRSGQGILSLLIGLIVFVMAGLSFAQSNLSMGLLYIAFGVVVIAYIPGSLWLRVNQTMKTNSVLSGVLHYEVSEKAIKVTAGEETAELPWEMIYKFVANDKNVLIYSNRINAYVIPRSQLGDCYESLVEIAKTQLPKYRLRIK